MDNSMLAHHGILGMKWGVRRTPAQLGKDKGSSNKKTAAEFHDDYQQAHSNNSIESMSDAELRKKINRLQMENQYSNLSESGLKRGKKWLDTVIKAGTTVATVTSTALTIYNNLDKIRKIVTPESG